jgi:hypothetical protein
VSRHHSRTWIEISRNTEETLPFELSVNPAIPSLAYVAQSAQQRKQLFADYYIQRRDAYRFEIHPSSEYSDGTVVVNALTVAKVVPFSVLLLMAVVAILGFQRSAYRSELRVLMGNKIGPALSESLSTTRFFAVPFERDRSRPESYLAVSPSAIVTGGLSLAVALLLVGIV